jgi:hypothetical protein
VIIKRVLTKPTSLTPQEIYDTARKIIKKSKASRSSGQPKLANLMVSLTNLIIALRKISTEDNKADVEIALSIAKEKLSFIKECRDKACEDISNDPFEKIIGENYLILSFLSFALFVISKSVIDTFSLGRVYYSVPMIIVVIAITPIMVKHMKVLKLTREFNTMLDIECLLELFLNYIDNRSLKKESINS